MVAVKTSHQVLIELAVLVVLVAGALILFLALPLVALEHLGKVMLVGKVLVALGGLVAAVAELPLLVQITQIRLLAALAVLVQPLLLLVLVLLVAVGVAVGVGVLLAVLAVLAAVELGLQITQTTRLELQTQVVAVVVAVTALLAAQVLSSSLTLVLPNSWLVAL